jgi:hypothetical protein
MLELLIIQVLLPDIYSNNYASELHIKFETDNFLHAPQIRHDNFIHKNVNKTKKLILLNLNIGLQRMTRPTFSTSKHKH